MNKLIILICLIFSGSASANPWAKTYRLVPVKPHVQSHTCGGQERMMKDVMTVHFDATSAGLDSANPLVNHVRWKVDGGFDNNNVTLVYRADVDAYTFLVLFLVNDWHGVYASLTLHGRTMNREECWDTVDLVAK